MIDLPLLALGNDPQVNRRRGLSETIRRMDAAVIADAYRMTVRNAPRRSITDSPFFVGHDGGGGVADISGEKVRAKALFNSGFPLVLEASQLQIVDYEIPLRSARSDAGIGEIDLAAIQEPGNRLWIVELKVFDNKDTPLKALLQALRYSAILEANRDQIDAEADRLVGLRLEWPAAIIVAADSAYWAKMRNTAPAGDWLSALKHLAETFATSLALEVRLLDLGAIRAEIREDGRAYLVEPPTVTTL